MIIALGGNAMTAPDGSATQYGQTEPLAAAMDRVADLIALGHEVVLTHRNGPQVGNLLVKNELAEAVVPPVTLEWCGAQTQGPVGFTVLNTFEQSLRAAEPRELWLRSSHARSWIPPIRNSSLRQDPSVGSLPTRRLSR